MPTQSQELANTLRQQAETVRVLVDAGFYRDDAVKAVAAADLAVLVDSDPA